MSAVTSQITAMRNETALAQTTQERTTGLKNDSNMFLTLMLKQLECQDPTEPTDNTQWLSQLAQYSSLEQMSQMNSGLEDCAKYINAMYDDMMINSEINQTLSMIGKDVTLSIPNEKDPEHPTVVSGNVTEASFESGSGQIKVNGQYYSIENVISIREK
jgi:flagellar basal-body rod modification protein FlgD